MLRTLIAIIISAYCATAYAQEAGQHGFKHSQGHDFYKTWKVPGTSNSCCSNEDCGRASIRSSVSAESGLELLAGDKWVEVPRNSILSMRSPDGQNHACWHPEIIEENGNRIPLKVFCVVLSNGT